MITGTIDKYTEMSLVCMGELSADTKYLCESVTETGEESLFRGYTIKESVEVGTPPFTTDYIEGESLFSGPVRVGNVVGLYRKEFSELLHNKPYRIQSLERLSRREFVLRLQPLDDLSTVEYIVIGSYPTKSMDSIQYTILYADTLSSLACSGITGIELRMVSDHWLATVFGLEYETMIFML